jgi:hypothetical protein
MGLDKWLESDKVKKKKVKESAGVSSERKDSKEKELTTPQSKQLLSKFTLICTNSKCKYQKILMKRKLVYRDKTCPKCKSEMSVKR